ncbi:MAG: ABC transporter substrate-binding protein [Acidaminococcaceae bacterium]|nr:ABC transporter substrate-binding protein [Acidaminococcaceae bacterium]
MKTKKFVSALLASAVALSLVAGCGGGDKKKPDEKKPAAAAGAVKVGVFLPLTGDNAAGGELELRGIKLANKLHPEINGKKIELVIADNKSDKAESANVVARLIEKDKVKVILGSYGSSLSMAAGNIVKDSKVPAIGTSCTNPQVTKGNEYYFRACFIDPFQGTVMANYAFKKGAKKVAIVQEVSNDYSVGLAKFFKEAFEKLAGPGSVVDIANYQTGDKDFTAQLTNLKAKNPDAIFAPGNFTESALLVKQARQLGIKVPFMGGDTWETQDFVNVGGKDVDGVAFSSAFDSTKAATPEAKAFLDAYAKEYKGEQPGGLTALAYDSYLIALNAMKAAGVEDSKKIRDAIASTKDLETTTGKTTLNADGDPIKSAVIKTVKDGKFTYIDMVNPGDLKAK